MENDDFPSLPDLAKLPIIALSLYEGYLFYAYGYDCFDISSSSPILYFLNHKFFFSVLVFIGFLLVNTVLYGMFFCGEPSIIGQIRDFFDEKLPMFKEMSFAFCILSLIVSFFFFLAFSRYGSSGYPIHLRLFISSWVFFFFFIFCIILYSIVYCLYFDFLDKSKSKKEKKETEELKEKQLIEEEIDLSHEDDDWEDDSPSQLEIKDKLSRQEVDIIFFIEEWRSISLQVLFDNFPHAGSYSNFSRKIQKLVDLEYLKYVLEEKRSRNKFISLSKKGYELTEGAVDSNAHYHEHDVIASMAVFYLARKRPFYAFSPSKQLSNSIKPDGILYGSHKDVEFQVAVEIELTTKSKHRIGEKVKEYLKEKHFKKILYIFRSPQLFHLFQRIISQSDRAKGKILLSLDKNLSPVRYNFDDSEWWPEDYQSIFTEE